MRPEFQVHVLNNGGLRKANEIAEGFSALHELVMTMVPVGRARALVATKLEEACFFAKRGMAEQPDNQAGWVPVCPDIPSSGAV